MSCYACTRKYGMFCKESGCANCGYSFCLKCLKKEIEIPRRNNAKHKVCLRCFEKLEAAVSANKGQSLSESPTPYSIAKKIEPNEIFQITDSSDFLGPVLQPMSSNAASISDESANSEEIVENLDSEILRRLNGLKTGDGQTVSDDNIRLRLCNLQGFQPKEYSKKDLLLSTDQRSEQEKINDLLKQFVDESHIDLNVAGRNHDSLSDIEKRLAALRDMDPSDLNKKTAIDPNTPSDNEEDDETLLKNIIQRYVDEVRLPTGGVDENESSNVLTTSTVQARSSEATEELPWCTICNEDADVRCQSCDGDLFCKGCFKECHQDDEEWRGHKTEPYGRPPTFKENHF